tara:strand:- start:6129 stop:6677 length:549 start_codon:yes stop_codon:yes gene_type:complete
MKNNVILEDTIKISDKGLEKVQALILENSNLLNHFNYLEKSLKEVKEALRRNTEEDIPNALEEFGMTEIKTKDGSSISVKQIYRGHISKANQGKAFEWLRDNNHGDLIKNEIKVSFGKGEDFEALDTKEYLNKRGQSFTDREYVHPQTLNAFVREQTEAGKPLADDLLGVHIGRVATIKKGE